MCCSMRSGAASPTLSRMGSTHSQHGGAALLEIDSDLFDLRTLRYVQKVRTAEDACRQRAQCHAQQAFYVFWHW